MCPPTDVLKCSRRAGLAFHFHLTEHPPNPGLEGWHTLRIFKENWCRWVGKVIPRRHLSGPVYFGALAADPMLIDGQGEITPHHFSVDEFGVSVGGDSPIG